MLAFHANIKIKKEYVARVKAHHDADEIIKGTYWERGKGCAVGCTIHGDQHSAYETELGIPRLIARLEDGIFEGMSDADAKKFPLRFLKAIPVGADLSLIFPQFMHWLLVDKEHGIIKFAKKPASKKAIKDVAKLFEKQIAGKTVSREEWSKVRAAADAYADAYADASAAADADADADAAAYAAAYAAADAAADAYAAADADASADAAAAYAYAYAADAYADAYAKQKARLIQAEKLLELLAAAPVVKQKKAA